MKDIYISGFADEISSSFDEQLKTVRELGMQYISLRSADKKGIADFTVEEVKTDLLPRLQAAGVGVSSLGSPIGKVNEVIVPGSYESKDCLYCYCRFHDRKYNTVKGSEFSGAINSCRFHKG